MNPPPRARLRAFDRKCREAGCWFSILAVCTFDVSVLRIANGVFDVKASQR